MRTTVLAVALAAVALLAAQHGSHAFTGNLSGSDGGLQGTGVWVDQSLVPPDQQSSWFPAAITWTVTQNPGGSWHYEYALNVYRGGVSHIILECSEGFGPSDIWNAEGSFESIEIGLFRPGPGNPSMPDSIYGIKFDSMYGTSVHISFDSSRRPIWGDIYLKDGKAGGAMNTLWNAGLANPDPEDAPSDGSIGAHILRPDTAEEVIPEPLSCIALGTGLAGSVLRRRRAL